MTDPYWTEHRAAYEGVRLIARRAEYQKQRRLAEAHREDSLRRGVEFRRGDVDFHRANALACELFGGNPDFELSDGLYQYVQIQPDPWKAPGFWRVHAVGGTYAAGVQRHCGSDAIRRHFGDALDPEVS